MKTLNSTPKKDGFRMPAEFEPHSGTYMIFPQRGDNWSFGAKFAQRTFAQIAAAISQYEPITMLASAEQYRNARAILPPHIRVVEMSSNDAWARDVGATFVVNDEGLIRGIDWKFNAWGGLVDGLYFPWDQDDMVAQKMCDLEHVDRYRLENFVLEGGSIHVDGQGTAITTEACLLSNGRNPSLSKKQIENVLKDYLNVSKVIWLKRGIFLDETNEHVDNICAFVSPACVVLAWTDDKSDPQYQLSKSCFEILSQERDALGRKIEIHKLPLPAPQTRTARDSDGFDIMCNSTERKLGERLAASYVNFYICNSAVIMPVFDDPHDLQAAQILDELFFDRQIVTLNTREVLLGGGNIHCVTQQLPAGVPPERQ
jgi:agmatine deiminase